MKINKLVFLSLMCLIKGSSLFCFDFTEKNQTITQNCYKDVKINAVVGTGGSLAIVLGSCNMQALQAMGKFGDIITLTNLPAAINVGTGAIPAGNIQSVKNIQTPPNGQKVLFSFIPSTGELAGRKINFVIEHVASANLDAEIAARGLGQAISQLKTNNPGQAVEMFVFYRSIPGVTTGWFDLGQNLTIASNVLPNLNVAVDDSGKLMISSNGSSSIQLFDLGQFQIQPFDEASGNAQAIAQTFKNLLAFRQQKSQ